MGYEEIASEVIAYAVGGTIGSGGSGASNSLGTPTGGSAGRTAIGGTASQGGRFGATNDISGNTSTGGSTLPDSPTGGSPQNSATGGSSSLDTITGGASYIDASGGSSSLGSATGGSGAGASSQGGTTNATSGVSGNTSTGGSVSLDSTTGGAPQNSATGGSSSLDTITGGASYIGASGSSSSPGSATGGSGVAVIGGASSQGGTSAVTTSSTGGSSAGGGTPTPYCNALPYLSAVPVLDGMLDANLRIETVVPQGWSNWTPPLPAGVSLAYATAWRENGLYFFLRVTDPDRNPAARTDPVWRGDAVEIYVDHDAVFAPPNTFDAVGTRQFIVGSPAAASSNSTRGDIFVADGIEGPWAATQWMGIATADGYIVEAFVVAADLSLTSLQLTAGQAIGFDLAHDVSYPIGQTGYFGNRLGQYFLQVRQPFTGQGMDYPFIDTSVFCTPTLARD